MKRLVLVLALVPAAVFAQPAAPQSSPALSMEQRMLVRCSAAFALAANRQQAGNQEALAWPALQERGSEYFIRASAEIMDQTGMNREAIARVLSAEAQDISGKNTLSQVMPHCLLSLAASGL
ncbi:hypothetical protein [Altericroceibacterium xinjiangense]|uniref:hypothetical protein n=1 Tax=Altericroceibacterium xinjiangense TaxID=762261 RepID=UPI000F7E52A3|nr:hypothetical protein [Altericroceibacterium xinjiangense]